MKTTYNFYGLIPHENFKKFGKDLRIIEIVETNDKGTMVKATCTSKRTLKKLLEK